MSTAVFHHLAPASEYRALPVGAAYLPARFDDEGFIHCTFELDVLLTIANQFYRQTPGEFLVLVIDPARLTSDLKYELPSPAPDGGPLAGRLFPHIYGPLNAEAVVGVRQAVRAEDGTFLAL